MSETDIQKLLQEANDHVPRLSFEEANNLIATANTLIIDVRETSEIEATGLIKNGYKKVLNLGGFSEWASFNGPIETIN